MKWDWTKPITQRSRAHYVQQRELAAREARDSGKTAFELVQECPGLDIDRVHRTYCKRLVAEMEQTFAEAGIVPARPEDRERDKDWP